MVVNDVGDGLRVGSGARAAAVDAVMDVRELVGDAVGLLCQPTEDMTDYGKDLRCTSRWWCACQRR